MNGWIITDQDNVRVEWVDGKPVRVGVTGHYYPAKLLEHLREKGWEAKAPDVAPDQWQGGDGDEVTQGIDARPL